MTEAQKPSIEAVSKLVTAVMEGRRFKGFRLDKVEYMYFPSSYNLTMTWEGRTLSLKIPSELVEDAVSKGDMFTRRKIKKMIKDVFGVGHEQDD